MGVFVGDTNLPPFVTVTMCAGFFNTAILDVGTVTFGVLGPLGLPLALAFGSALALAFLAALLASAFSTCGVFSLAMGATGDAEGAVFSLAMGSTGVAEGAVFSLAMGSTGVAEGAGVGEGGELPKMGTGRILAGVSDGPKTKHSEVIFFL